MTRLRNPARRFWISLLAPAIVGRGPHRIWVPSPASAGCEVIDDLGTTSADSAVAVVGSRARGQVAGRKVVVDVAGVGREGRRLGREEKALLGSVLERFGTLGGTIGLLGNEEDEEPYLVALVVLDAQRTAGRC